MFYVKQILIALDQLINAFCFGWADETLSSRAWRWHVAGGRHIPCKVIDALFWWDKEHCYNSYISEREGRHLPPELR